MTQAEINAGLVAKQASLTGSQASISGSAETAANVDATVETVVELPRRPAIELGDTPTKDFTLKICSARCAVWFAAFLWFEG